MKRNMVVTLIFSLVISLSAMDSIDRDLDALEKGTLTPSFTHPDLRAHIANKDFASFAKTLAVIKSEKKSSKKSRAAGVDGTQAAAITTEVVSDLLTFLNNTKVDERNRILKENTIKFVSTVGWIAPMVIVDIQQNQAPVAIISAVLGSVSLKNFYDIFTSTRQYMSDNNLTNIGQLLQAEAQMLTGQSSSSSSQPAPAAPAIVPAPTPVATPASAAPAPAAKTKK